MLTRFSYRRGVCNAHALSKWYKLRSHHLHCALPRRLQFSVTEFCAADSGWRVSCCLPILTSLHQVVYEEWQLWSWYLLLLRSTVKLQQVEDSWPVVVVDMRVGWCFVHLIMVSTQVAIFGWVIPKFHHIFASGSKSSTSISFPNLKCKISRK